MPKSTFAQQSKKSLKEYFNITGYISKKFLKDININDENQFYAQLDAKRREIKRLPRNQQQEAIDRENERIEALKTERKKVKTSKANKEQYQLRTKFNSSRVLMNEYTDFLNNLDKLPNTRRSARGMLKNRKVVSFRTHNDRHIRYTFDVDLELRAEEGMEHDLVNKVIAEFDKASQLKSIQQLLNQHLYLQYQVVITKTNTDGVVGNPDISTTFLPNVAEVEDDLRYKILAKVREYEAFNLYISEIRINFMTNNAPVGAGSVSRSIKVANDVWKIMNAHSKGNCLYSAITFCLKPQDFLDYDTNLNTQRTLVNRAKMLKQRISKTFNFKPKKKYSGIEEIKACAEQLKTSISVYNNIFSKVPSLCYDPEVSVRDKRTKPRNTIEIQLEKGHYRALVRWRDIQDYEKKPELTTQQQEEDDTDTIIKKKVFNEEYHTRYGAYDIEATPNPYDNNYHKSYSCGLSYYLNDKIKHKQWWGFDCQIQFLRFLKANIDIFKNYTFYAHNGGRYDYPNMYRECLKLNILQVTNVLILNNSVIGFSLTDGNISIHFKDSVKMFANTPLETLLNSFKVQHRKLTELVKHTDITYHNFMTYKTEVSKYLEHDCSGLLECILAFSDKVYKGTGINLSKCYTGATLSKLQWYKNHYNSKWKPIYFLSKKKDKFIRPSYFGGRTEAFYNQVHLKGKFYYYDFTSLYPSEARKPLPYDKPEWRTLNSLKDFEDFFGFCEVYVKTKDFTRTPLHANLKKVSQSQRLLFSHYEEWTKMLLFSEEIRLGMIKGLYDYKFENSTGIHFEKAPYMKGFFEVCFDAKQKATKEKDKVMKQVWKIIANSGYGFWGLNAHDRESVMIEKTEETSASLYLQSGKLQQRNEVGDYTILKVEKDLELKDFNVSIASAITSYARMRLWRLIDDIRRKGYEVYYCDTDSVITNCNIKEHYDLVRNYQWDKTGEALGSLKNECEEKILEINVDIQQQTKLDGGELYFDELILNGCKYYSLRKTCYNGEVIDTLKCKGYKEGRKGEDNYNPLTWEKMKEVAEGGELYQVQTQFNIPISSFLDEQRNFGLNVIQVPKKFKATYNKGIRRAEDGKIIPFIFNATGEITNLL
jgi:hypothetical protein